MGASDVEPIVVVAATFSEDMDPDGVGWGTAALIEMENAGQATFPALAISPVGSAVVAWQYFDGTRRHIRSSAFR